MGVDIFDTFDIFDMIIDFEDFSLFGGAALVAALEMREVDSQMWSTSLSDFAGKNAPFGKGILNSATEVNAKHHGVTVTGVKRATGFVLSSLGRRRLH